MSITVDMRENFELELRSNGGMARIVRDSPLRGQADRSVARGDTVRILPGVVAATGAARHVTTMIQALKLWHRDATLVGMAALVLLGLKNPVTQRCWDYTGIQAIEAFSPTRRLRRPRIWVHRWHVPHYFTIEDEGIRVAIPEVSVIILAIQGQWDWVCQALRQRLVTPASCRAARKALTGRYSKAEVDRALADIDLNPWSIPELELARILRATGITGHKPNHQVWVGEGNYRYVLDQAFQAEMLGVEMEGRSVHGTPEGYEAMMVRSAHLEQAGWRILHATPTMLRRDPKFVLDWIINHLHKRHRPKTTLTNQVLRQIMNSAVPA